MKSLVSTKDTRADIRHSVHAHLIERFIFNFRLKPEALATHLPVSYLLPQVFGGWSIISFCLLRLDRIILSPLPALLNMRSLSCAYRCGVIDITGEEPVPSVYIPERYTDRFLISQLGPWIFSSTIPQIRSSLTFPTQTGESRTLRASFWDGRPLFQAEIKPSVHPEELDSRVFDSMAAFAHFLRSGVSSYTPAIDENMLARVDLQKQDTTYESCSTTIEYNLLADLWPEADLTFDSVVRASGCQYIWTYQGLVEKE